MSYISLKYILKCPGTFSPFEGKVIASLMNDSYSKLFSFQRSCNIKVFSAFPRRGFSGVKETTFRVIYILMNQETSISCKVIPFAKYHSSLWKSDYIFISGSSIHHLLQSFSFCGRIQILHCKKLLLLQSVARIDLSFGLSTRAKVKNILVMEHQLEEKIVGRGYVW